jgi:O-antigen/teichoic acid export membrane protein
VGYLRTTIRGLSWIGALRGFTRTIAFIKIAILARLLLPEQFGLVGIALLTLSFLEIVTETGINIFLIQEKDELKEYLDTAWLVSIFRGLIIALILFLSAPLVAFFFKSPQAQQILYLTALVPLIRGFINPAVVRFQKELLFSKEFFLRSSLFFLDALVAIFVALITRSAQSLVWGMVAGAIFEVVFSQLAIKPKPQLRFEKAKFIKVVNRGKWVTLAGFFEYLFREVDDIAVGRFLNTASLGIYQVAYKISCLPITEIANTFSRVTFPIYVQIIHEPQRLKKAYLKTSISILALTALAGILLFFLARPFVILLLGKNWLEVVPIIKILAFFGFLQSFSLATQPLFLAVKRQEYVTLVTLTGILGIGLTIIPLVKNYGVIGASLAALFGAIIQIPVNTFFVLKLFKQLK